MAITTFSGPVKSLNGFIVGAGATVNKILANSATLDFTSIGAGAQGSLTITVVGATVGNAVALALPAAPAAGLAFDAFVSATDTVTVRASNVSGSPVDAGPATYGVIVFGA
jgi:hypothetical protein